MSRRHVFAALLVGAVATSLVSCNSGSNSSVTNPIDLSPPQAPTNLHTYNDPRINRDWVLWDPSASASVAGYEVYSAPTSSASGSLVATLDPTATNYMLPISNVDLTEFYRVRAIGTNNVPSAFTSSLSVTRVKGDGLPPATPGPGRGTEGDF